MIQIHTEAQADGVMGWSASAQNGGILRQSGIRQDWISNCRWKAQPQNADKVINARPAFVSFIFSFLLLTVHHTVLCCSLQNKRSIATGAELLMMEKCRWNQYRAVRLCGELLIFFRIIEVFVHQWRHLSLYTGWYQGRWCLTQLGL